MTPIRSILAATDLNEGADDALRAAAALAALTGAQLHVLHALEDLRASSYLAGDKQPPTFQALVAKVNDGLDAQIARTVRGTPVASREVRIFVAFKAIRDRAQDVEADVVVLGRHRKRAGAGAFLGSTADRVIRTLEVPCLIVGSPLRMPLERVLIPIDLSEPALHALDVALAWTGSLGPLDHAPELIVLHVIPRVFDASDVPIDQNAIASTLRGQVEAASERAGMKQAPGIREEVRWADSVPDEILRCMRDEDADLVVLGTHGYGALKRALIGSVAAAVSRAAGRPVLLVPPAMWKERDN